MRHFRLAVVGLGLLVTSGQAAPLQLADLSISGLAWGADTAEARQALGAPATARNYDALGYDQEHLHLTDWTYSGLSLRFSNGRLLLARLTGRRWRTHRGLRVGDAVERIAALYGEPPQEHAVNWYYPITEGRDRRLGLYTVTSHHRVTTIVIGQISDAT